MEFVFAILSVLLLVSLAANYIQSRDSAETARFWEITVASLNEEIRRLTEYQRTLIRDAEESENMIEILRDAGRARNTEIIRLGHELEQMRARAEQAEAQLIEAEIDLLRESDGVSFPTTTPSPVIEAAEGREIISRDGDLTVR